MRHTSDWQNMSRGCLIVDSPKIAANQTSPCKCKGFFHPCVNQLLFEYGFVLVSSNAQVSLGTRNVSTQNNYSIKSWGTKELKPSQLHFDVCAYPPPVVSFPCWSFFEYSPNKYGLGSPLFLSEIYLWVMREPCLLSRNSMIFTISTKYVTIVICERKERRMKQIVYNSCSSCKRVAMSFHRHIIVK